MAQISLKGKTIQTSGNLPKKGKLSPPFTLVKKDLSQTGLGDYPHEVRADAEADNGHFDGETTE